MEQSRTPEALLKELTLDEKIGMIHGGGLFRTEGVERLGIPPLKFSDGPMGVRPEFENAHWKSIGFSDDYVTYLPCNTAIAATWNPQIAYEAGSVLGEETRGRGKDVILAPGVNIKRSPLCGRNFEYYSEDPLLTARMAASCIKGIQQWDVAACVKHFAVNSQETERLWMESVVSDDVLEEIYFPAFKAAVEAGVHTVMGAYNKLWGAHCCHNEKLLDEVLRKKWGFEGVVVSDWGGVHDTKEAAKSSLDVEMSVTDDFDRYYMAEPLKKAVRSGEIPEEWIDKKVLRILKLMDQLHMLNGERKAGTYNTVQHRETVLKAARESIVLLKNEKNALPLKKEKVKKLLVIGDNGERLHALGGGSAEIKALYELSPLMGLHMVLGGNCRIDFTRGYLPDTMIEEMSENGKKAEEVNWQAASLENGGGQRGKETAKDSKKLKITEQIKAEMRNAERSKALKLAKEGGYDQVIYIGGLDHAEDCEGHDRDSLTLPYEQDLLIEGLLEFCPDAVIALMGGNPVEMHRWSKKARSIVYSWYGGCEGGLALAEVLFGLTVPSGKLPQTFPEVLSDSPEQVYGEFAGAKEVHYNEGKLVGYRYYDTFRKEVEFCFGHGLSYTEFTYSNLMVSKEEDAFKICVKVKNTGNVEGAEVIQLYAGPEKQESVEKNVEKLKEPTKELADFKKIWLKPGEEKEICLFLTDVKKKKYQEKTGIRILVGSSSRDIRLSGIITDACGTQPDFHLHIF